MVLMKDSAILVDFLLRTYTCISIFKMHTRVFLFCVFVAYFLFLRIHVCVCDPVYVDVLLCAFRLLAGLKMHVQLAL